MGILDVIRRNSTRIRNMGREAIEDSKKNGVSAYYVEDSSGLTITKENPDGSKEYLSVEEEATPYGARLGK